METINKLWLIHREIGMCLLEQTFKPLPTDVDSDLVSGFLTAMLSFSEQIAKEKIERIELETTAIQYYISDVYVMAVICPRSVSKAILKTKLDLLATEFNEKYGDVLENFTGNVDVFQDYGKKVEEIVEQPTISIKYLSKTREQLEYYLNKRKSEFDQLRGTIENFIEDKAKGVKNMLESKFKKVSTKLKDTLKP